MTADQCRALIRARLDQLGCSVNRAAGLAGLPESRVRNYLAGADSTAGAVLALAAVLGLEVTARPRKGFGLPPTRGPGRQAKTA